MLCREKELEAKLFCFKNWIIKIELSERRGESRQLSQLEESAPWPGLAAATALPGIPFEIIIFNSISVLNYFFLELRLFIGIKFFGKMMQEIMSCRWARVRTRDCHVCLPSCNPGFESQAHHHSMLFRFWSNLTLHFKLLGNGQKYAKRCHV